MAMPSFSITIMFRGVRRRGEVSDATRLKMRGKFDVFTAVIGKELLYFCLEEIFD